MGKIKTFIYTLGKSFTSPAYYSDILKARLSFSWKYFLVFFFFYALIGTVFVGVVTIPTMSRFLKVLPGRVASVYPSELEIYVKNGTVSTNVQEPYAIPLTKFEDVFSDRVLGESTMAGTFNLMVIDTKGGNIENFKDYNTLALVTEKNIITQDKNGVLNVYSIGSTINLTINKALVSQTINKFSPYLNYVAPLMVVMVFLGLLIFSPSSYLSYLIFFAFVLWLFSRMVKPELSYAKSYQLGMHMCTITATLSGLLTLLNLRFSIPFAQTIFLLVFSYFVLAEIKKSQANVPVPSSPPVSNPPTPPPGIFSPGS